MGATISSLAMFPKSLNIMIGTKSFFEKFFIVMLSTLALLIEPCVGSQEPSTALIFENADYVVHGDLISHHIDKSRPGYHILMYEVQTYCSFKNGRLPYNIHVFYNMSLATEKLSFPIPGHAYILFLRDSSVQIQSQLNVRWYKISQWVGWMPYPWDTDTRNGEEDITNYCKVRANHCPLPGSRACVNTVIWPAPPPSGAVNHPPPPVAHSKNGNGAGGLNYPTVSAPFFPMAASLISCLLGRLMV